MDFTTFAARRALVASMYTGFCGGWFLLLQLRQAMPKWVALSASLPLLLAGIAAFLILARGLHAYGSLTSCLGANEAPLAAARHKAVARAYSMLGLLITLAGAARYALGVPIGNVFPVAVFVTLTLPYAMLAWCEREIVRADEAPPDLSQQFR